MKRIVGRFLNLTVVIGLLSACVPVFFGDDTLDEENHSLTILNCLSNVPFYLDEYIRCVDIKVDDDYVNIVTTGLPPHNSNYYLETSPNFVEFDDTRGKDYFESPNKLEANKLTFSVPRNPVARDIVIDEELVDGLVTTSEYEYPPGPAGVALDGVFLFSHLAESGGDIAQEQYSFDAYNGHPSEDGEYHYHTASRGPLEVLRESGEIQTVTPGAAEKEIYGVMCDGTIVLGCTETDGRLPTSSEFDSQNGHVHDLLDEGGDSLIDERYHTHICPGEFPQWKNMPEIQYYTECKILR